MTLPPFSIFIPAYNAEHTLAGVLRRIPTDMWAAVNTVWIVNDGSADGTWSEIEKARAAWPKVNGVNLPHNRGYGGAVKEALKRIRAENVAAAVCIHADGQYAPEEIPRLLNVLDGERFDLLQGSRIASGTALSGGMPLYKYLAGRFLTFLENRVFRKAMTDYHSGCLVYGRKALDAIRFEQLSDSFEFDLEVIASALALKLNVGETPIPTHYGGEKSHLNPVAYGLRVLRVLWRYLRGRYSKIHAAR